MTSTSTILDSIPVQRADDPAVTWTLVEAAQTGDREAIGALYRIYHDTVLRYLRRRTGGDMHLADDLAADVWVRAIRSIGGLTWQGRDFGAWLITLARNLLADHFKSSRTRLTTAVAEFGDTPDQLDLEQLVADRVSNAALAGALKHLTPDQRECIRLRFMCGLEVAEVAAAMGVTAGAAKALQYRAVRALAKNLPTGVTR